MGFKIFKLGLDWSLYKTFGLEGVVGLRLVIGHLDIKVC